MYDFLLVSLGAILGANIRFKIYNQLDNLGLKKDFFILIINTFASFFLGLFLSIIERFGSFVYSYQLALFFSVGFMGSLSTFSSFIYDVFDLCLRLKFSRAFKLLIISLLLGIIGFGLGLELGNK